MKIEIRFDKPAESIKTILSEIIEDLEKVSNDYSVFIDPENIEIVIEY